MLNLISERPFSDERNLTKSPAATKYDHKKWLKLIALNCIIAHNKIKHSTTTIWKMIRNFHFKYIWATWWAAYFHNNINYLGFICLQHKRNIANKCTRMMRKKNECEMRKEKEEDCRCSDECRVINEENIEEWKRKIITEFLEVYSTSSILIWLCVRLWRTVMTWKLC